MPNLVFANGIIALLIIPQNEQDQTLLWTCASAHLQCVNNHYTKFEFKGRKSVLITDHTQITQCKHSKGGVDVIMFRLNTPKNIIKCA